MNQVKLFIKSSSCGIFNSLVRNYAVKQGIKSLGSKNLKSVAKDPKHTVVLPVEKDADKLVNYVCGTNLYQENGENVKIKADSEYPDWLWTLHTGKPLTLEEMDSNSLKYWLKVRRIRRREAKKLRLLYREKLDKK